MAANLAAEGHLRRLQLGFLAERGGHGGQHHRLIPREVQADMLNLRLLAEAEFHHLVHLIGDASGALMRGDDLNRSALAHLHDHTRQDARGRTDILAEGEMQLGLSARRHVDHHAIARESGVEIDHQIACLAHAEAGRRAIAIGIGQRLNRHALGGIAALPTAIGEAEAREAVELQRLARHRIIRGGATVRIRLRTSV